MEKYPNLKEEIPGSEIPSLLDRNFGVGLSALCFQKKKKKKAIGSMPLAS